MTINIPALIVTRTAPDGTPHTHALTASEVIALGDATRMADAQILQFARELDRADPTAWPEDRIELVFQAMRDAAYTALIDLLVIPAEDWGDKPF